MPRSSCRADLRPTHDLVSWGILANLEGFSEASGADARTGDDEREALVLPVEQPVAEGVRLLRRRLHGEHAGDDFLYLLVEGLVLVVPSVCARKCLRIVRSLSPRRSSIPFPNDHRENTLFASPWAHGPPSYARTIYRLQFRHAPQKASIACIFSTARDNHGRIVPQSLRIAGYHLAVRRPSSLREGRGASG